MSVLKYTVKEKMLLKTFLKNQNISKKSLSAIKQNGALFVNDVPVTVRYALNIGDRIEIHLPKEKVSPFFIPSNQPLDILYEDCNLCIVNKPPFVNTIPSQLHPHDSLIERVLYHFLQMGDESNPHPVNRLDRNTSGIVVFAKHQLMHHLMTGIIEKFYVTNVVGQVTTDGNICFPIARKEDSIIERVVSVFGKHARTEYKCVRRSQSYSQLRVKLHTGRTHQIRVHFSSIGHPLQGDTLYGDDNTISRHALHAEKIIFIHPLLHKKIVITCPCPKDMQFIE